MFKRSGEFFKKEEPQQPGVNTAEQQPMPKPEEQDMKQDDILAFFNDDRAPAPKAPETANTDRYSYGPQSQQQQPQVEPAPQPAAPAYVPPANPYKTTAETTAAPEINPAIDKWDQYFLDIMDAVAKRATCDRGRSGSVIAKDKTILSTGYVGSPAKMPHCDEVGHLLKRVVNEDGTSSEHCMRTAHAEANAICQAAKNGIAIKGATLYCIMVPCRDCAMMISNSGIAKVVARYEYHGSSAQESKEILRVGGVELVVLMNKGAAYTDAYKRN